MKSNWFKFLFNIDFVSNVLPIILAEGHKKC